MKTDVLVQFLGIQPKVGRNYKRMSWKQPNPRLDTLYCQKYKHVNRVIIRSIQLHELNCERKKLYHSRIEFSQCKRIYVTATSSCHRV